MRQILKYGLVAAALALSAPAAMADNFALLNNQRISCSRGLSPGKMSTATCRSHAYLFNASTSEYYRCSASVAMTRDGKEVINVQTDSKCVKKPRIFDTDSVAGYSFDGTETEPPNTNSFFGPGGEAAWASDNAARRLRACITVPSGLGSDVVRCMDMKFD